MAKHRLSDIMPNGHRWSAPASNTVFVAHDGDICHTARGILGSTGRTVDTGFAWREGDE
jgi:hypothetical protein